ncbi:MAG: RNA helicase [Sclerophora amabilis]|nr:MAG: RNA helicase [Sclerophora amabilis]
MTLSPKVAQPSPRISPSGKPSKRKASSPFGGMNMREAGIRSVPERRSAAADKRSGLRGKEPTKPTSDYKALKMQQTLSPISYGRRSSVKDSIREVESFDQFESLLPIVRESIYTQALSGLDNVSPTPVQRVTIPALLGSEHTNRRRRVSGGAEAIAAMDQFLIAAETGSGKTLAYLLPVVDAIKRAEAVDTDIEAHEKAVKEEKERDSLWGLESPPLTNQPHPTTGRPRAIILLPTSELVSQVGSVTKKLSHRVKFRSALISSAYSGRVIRNRLFSPSGVDILISTPHLIASIAESDPNILSRVTHLVVDEADSLLDRSFSPTTSAIIDRATPSLRQLILCSATIPRSLDSYLRQRFPDIRRLVTPNLHAIPRRVQLGVVDVEKEPYRGNKSLACADSIYTIGKTAAEHASSPGELHKDKFEFKRVLVFVNEREKAQEVADYLVSKGIDALALSRDTPEQRQSEILSAFTIVTQPASDRSSMNSATPNEVTHDVKNPNFTPAFQSPNASKRSLPNTKVLVTTDLGSRGIDTLPVRHVILYDVPHSTIDFIHRLGRTGRMGRRGRGIVLIGKGDRKDVVREVREGMFKGQALI